MQTGALNNFKNSFCNSHPTPVFVKYICWLRVSVRGGGVALAILRRTRLEDGALREPPQERLGARSRLDRQHPSCGLPGCAAVRV